MARTSTALHFGGTAEEAFLFYKEAFGTEFVGPIVRIGDVSMSPDLPELSEDDKKLVMNVELPITGGHLLVGNDAPAWMGEVIHGNAVDICIDPDTRAEADRIFAALSEGASVEFPLQEASEDFYYGSLVDKFGTQWAVRCTAKA